MTYLKAADAGVRVNDASDMTNIGFMTKPYLDRGTGKLTEELSLHMCFTTENIHIPGAVPVVDILKFVIKNHPELLDQARSELGQS